jgi:hypothetical protein
MQFAPLCVKREILEEIAQAAIPSGATHAAPVGMKNKPPVRKM